MSRWFGGEFVGLSEPYLYQFVSLRILVLRTSIYRVRTLDRYPEGRMYELGLLAVQKWLMSINRAVFLSFCGNNSLFILPFGGPVKKNFLVHSLLDTSLDIGARRT